MSLFNTLRSERPLAAGLARPRSARLGPARPLPSVLATTPAGRYLARLRWLFTGRR